MIRHKPNLLCLIPTGLAYKTSSSVSVSDHLSLYLTIFLRCEQHLSFLEVNIIGTVSVPCIISSAGLHDIDPCQRKMDRLGVTSTSVDEEESVRSLPNFAIRDDWAVTATLCTNCMTSKGQLEQGQTMMLCSRVLLLHLRHVYSRHLLTIVLLYSARAHGIALEKCVTRSSFL